MALLLPTTYPQPYLTLSASSCNGPDTNPSPTPTARRQPDTDVVNRCTASMATDCTAEGTSTVYLDGVPKGVWACEPCVAFAERAGMNPVADRRAVERIPEWRKRSLAKDLTSWRVAS